MDDTDLIERLRERVPTVGATSSLSDVDLHEWDCVVTRNAWTSDQFTEGQRGHYNEQDTTDRWEWSQYLPPHVSVVFAVRPVEYRRTPLVLHDFWPPEGEGVDPPDVVLVREHGVQGRHVSLVEGLPERLTELVKRHLLPVAEQRSQHTIFDVRGKGADGEHPLHLTPLLYGPRESFLAAMYERSDEASVWLLPEDIDDLLAWVVAALSEWHDMYPARFPSLPDWPNDQRFRTSIEVQLHAELDEKKADIRRLIDQYLATEKEIEARLALADADAATFERALLTQQGEPLAAAVLRALEALGFQVRDMDAEREGQPKKEDYRITDPETPGWTAIGEAKGFVRGVKEIGMLSLERWASAYIMETRTEPSARWYIANQHLREDPDTRPAPFESRPDLVEQMEESGTLLIDTYAVFRLVRAVQNEPALAGPVRARLRERVGRLSHEDAISLLDEARSDVSDTTP